MGKDKKIEQVREILTLAIDITNNTEADVFVDYSGHINGLSVRVFLKGWKPEYDKYDFNKILYLDRDNVNELQEIIDYLKEIKEEN